MAPIIPDYDPNKVLTGQCRLFTQDHDPSTPAVLPDPELELGGDWGVLWTPIGATLEGVTKGFSREVSSIRIEEQITDVDQRTTSAALTFTTQLSEDTLESMLLAFGGGDISVIAAATGVPGRRKLVIAEDIRHFAIGFETHAAPNASVTDGDPWRRMLVPKVSSTADVEAVFRRAERQRAYQVTFTSLVPMSSIVIEELNADALA